MKFCIMLRETKMKVFVMNTHEKHDRCYVVQLYEVESRSLDEHNSHQVFLACPFYISFFKSSRILTL
jgi:hypothetical protein